MSREANCKVESITLTNIFGTHTLKKGDSIEFETITGKKRVGTVQFIGVYYARGLRKSIMGIVVDYPSKGAMIRLTLPPNQIKRVVDSERGEDA